MGGKDLKADVHEKTSSFHTVFCNLLCLMTASTAFVVVQNCQGVKVTVLPAIKDDDGGALFPVLPLNII